jgi:hypothetical protein
VEKRGRYKIGRNKDKRAGKDLHGGGVLAEMAGQNQRPETTFLDRDQYEFDGPVGAYEARAQLPACTAAPAT